MASANCIAYRLGSDGIEVYLRRRHLPRWDFRRRLASSIRLKFLCRDDGLRVSHVQRFMTLTNSFVDMIPVAVMIYVRIRRLRGFSTKHDFFIRICFQDDSMARPQTGRPTDQELEILKVLWDGGPSSVRDVWQKLSETREIGQTSVLKTMQIMRDKGLLICDTDQRPQVFQPAQSQKATLKQLAGDLIGRVFGGSTSLLLQHAMESKKATRAELEEMRALLDKVEKSK